MPDRDPLIYRIMEQSDGSDPYCILTPPVKRGSVWFCERVAICNDDKAGQVADIGVISGRGVTYLSTVTLTTAGIWYGFRCNITLLTSYQVVVCFRATDVDDHLRVNVNGYVREPFTSP